MPKCRTRLALLDAPLGSWRYGMSIVVALAACAGCSPARADAPPSDDGGARPDVSDGLVPSQLPANFHCDPTLQSIHDTIFLTSCAFDSCHGDNNFAYMLWLSADVSRVSTELVDAPSQSCKPWLLVSPGDPEHSFLYDKLSSKTPACGYRMPRGIEPLPQPALDCVRAWIQSL